MGCEPETRAVEHTPEVLIHSFSVAREQPLARDALRRVLGMEIEGEPDDLGAEPAPQPVGRWLADTAERSDVVAPDEDRVVRHACTLADVSSGGFDTIARVVGGRFLVSLPERIVRGAVAVAGGAVYEAAQLLLPRLVRRSRLYEATAKNLLRVAIELVGGVEGAPSRDAGLGARDLAVRKGAGNVVELGSIAAFGFSPLWLLAGASDLLRGSRVYLRVLVEELKRAGVVADDVEVASVEELLGVLERGAGQSARLIDIPPLELAELRRSLAELRSERDALPSEEELAALFEGLRRTARQEERPLLEVSAGVGLAFLLSARKVSREHLVVPYEEDWRPLRREGFAAYSRRVSRPYRTAVARHLDPQASTWTDRALDRVSNKLEQRRRR